MAWNERDRMSLRREFIRLAREPDANISALCAHYGISRKTGYKWLKRAEESLEDRSRRPLCSPGRTADWIEQRVLEIRDAHPAWGARKLQRVLQNQGLTDLPAASTITAVLHRHGRITPEASEAAQRWQRFEHAAPNDLWQMDFKGHFAMANGRCHAFTVTDDCSRFNIALQACGEESYGTVQPALEAAFRRYGMPWRISCDNGSPWGTGQREDSLTRLGAWLARLDIRVSHARVCHPQTNGKEERFHRTLDQEVLRHRVFNDLTDAQRAFDAYRIVYNIERPHAALGLNVPISRYERSERVYPDTLPEVVYDADWLVRTVDACGSIHFQNRAYRISRALCGQRVGLRFDAEQDGRIEIFYCRRIVKIIDLRVPNPAP